MPWKIIDKATGYKIERDDQGRVWVTWAGAPKFGFGETRRILSDPEAYFYAAGGLEAVAANAEAEGRAEEGLHLRALAELTLERAAGLTAAAPPPAGESNK